MDYQKYKNRFKEAEKVVKQLSEKDLRYICNSSGVFVDSPRVIYRDIFYIKDKSREFKPVGFIDVYKFGNDTKLGFIVLAVIDSYRGKGIASQMVRKMEEEINAPDVKYFLWRADKNNKASIALGKSLGYQFYQYHGDEMDFYKPNPSYKED